MGNEASRYRAVPRQWDPRQAEPLSPFQQNATFQPHRIGVFLGGWYSGVASPAPDDRGAVGVQPNGRVVRLSRRYLTSASCALSASSSPTASGLLSFSDLAEHVRPVP